MVMVFSGTPDKVSFDRAVLVGKTDAVSHHLTSPALPLPREATYLAYVCNLNNQNLPKVEILGRAVGFAHQIR